MRAGHRGTFFGGTGGLGITQLPHDRYPQNLTFRPEIRNDGSANDSPIVDERHLTAAIDVVYKF